MGEWAVGCPPSASALAVMFFFFLERRQETEVVMPGLFVRPSLTGGRRPVPPLLSFFLFPDCGKVGEPRGS